MGNVASRCKFCNKEFNDDTGLMAHFNDKHRADRGGLGINEIKRHRISVSSMLIIAVVACCGVPLLLGIGGIGFFSFLAGQHSQTGAAQRALNASVGEPAPNIPITLTNGTTLNLSSFRGKPVVLWFVATWCSSCADSASLLANDGYYNKIHAKGAELITVELYDDLGYSGPSISAFADSYGGGTQNPGWLYGTSSLNATYSYDPKGYLDIYYVIDPKGVITNEGVGLAANLDAVVSSL